MTRFPSSQDPRSGRRALAAALAGALLMQAAAAAQPDGARAQALTRLVRQDCGACHGGLLKGGLGPALSADALRDKPREALVATVLGGRPGTPMPPWRALLTEEDAAWIVDRLQAGFPRQ